MSLYWYNVPSLYSTIATFQYFENRNDEHPCGIRIYSLFTFYFLLFTFYSYTLIALCTLHFLLLVIVHSLSQLAASEISFFRDVSNQQEIDNQMTGRGAKGGQENEGLHTSYSSCSDYWVLDFRFVVAHPILNLNLES